MKNGTIKKLTIAAVALLGATYILGKYNYNKAKLQIAKRGSNINEEEFGEMNEVSDFSVVPERKYHILEYPKPKATKN